LKELAKFQDGWQDAFGIVNARVHGYIPVAADLIKSRQAAQTHKQRHWQPLKVQIHSQQLCFCIRGLLVYRNISGSRKRGSSTELSLVACDSHAGGLIAIQFLDLHSDGIQEGSAS